MENSQKSRVLSESLDSIKEKLLLFHQKEDSDILTDLLAEKSMYTWLHLELDFCLQVDVLKLIAKACACKANSGLQFQFIQNLLSQKAFLITFLSRLLSAVSSHRDCDIESLCKLIFDIVHSIFQRVPLSSIEFTYIILPQLQVILEKNLNESNSELMHDIAELLEQRNNICQLESLRQEERKKDKDILPPPCDFRTIALLPDKNEIESQTRPYLRANVVNGPYESADHYLDVQFRLMREDMFRYLRESIAEYKRRTWSHDSSAMLENGYIYFNVKIWERNYRNRVLFTADVPMGKTVNWSTTKKLNPKSLLCISCDGFETFTFVCVHSRSAHSTDASSCFVEFYPETKSGKECIQLSKLYDMIETTSFYESYKYVLQRLQLFYLETFPLKTSILFLKDCNQKPKYWEKTFRYSSMLLQEKDAYQKMLTLSALESFDKHQQLAFQMALSNQVSVIQGPPGTGKTYLGLQIVKWLLQNASEHRRSPILVVCYTNHALDQFLEGVLMYTNKVVRIGGQCKNPTLEPHNINKIADAIQEYIKLCKRLGRCERCQECSEYFCSDHSLYFCSDHSECFCSEHSEYYYSEHSECFCSKRPFKVSYEGNANESLNVGQKILPSLSLESVGLRTVCIKECEMVLENIEELMLRLDTNPIYDESILNELLPEHVWTQMLGCSGLVGKTRNMIPKMVKQLEKWLCLSTPYLHAYEDEPELLYSITEEFIRYIDEGSYPDVKIALNNDSQLLCQPTSTVGNAFISGLLEMRLKMEPFSSDANVNHRVQCFFRDNALNQEMIFRVLEKSVSKFLEQNNFDVKPETHNIWENEIKSRWMTFLSWKSDFRLKLLDQLQTLQECYLEEIEERENAMTRNYIRIAKGAEVLGLTTTGAAKHWKMLEEVGPHVVIAEEAAEVLEAHVTTALNRSTEHLILIGDHKQLRPIPFVHELGRKYKLEISMFERLLTNGVPSHCLQTQHRMRPCIAQLLVPEIYDNLENHSSVLEYEDIRGVSSNIYFIKHTVHEDTSSDLRSHRNKHEADFLASLCHYLLQQGYDESSITVLTTYVGQLKFLNEAIKQKHKYNVRITTVDNFQGEENDIILLSFVRSNLKNALGFLKISNRICVALSRARKGLFCIGNFDSFAEECYIWKKITQKLEKMHVISSALPLKCPNHPERITTVSCESDFKKVPHGGCMEKCTYRLGCGHVCVLYCHAEIKKHDERICSRQCEGRSKERKSTYKEFTQSFKESSGNFEDGGHALIPTDQYTMESTSSVKKSVTTENCSGCKNLETESSAYSPSEIFCDTEFGMNEKELRNIFESHNALNNIRGEDLNTNFSKTGVDSLCNHDTSAVSNVDCDFYTMDEKLKPVETKSQMCADNEVQRCMSETNISCVISNTEFDIHRDETSEIRSEDEAKSANVFSDFQPCSTKCTGDDYLVMKSSTKTEMQVNSRSDVDFSNLKSESSQKHEIQQLTIGNTSFDVWKLKYDVEYLVADENSERSIDTEKRETSFVSRSCDHRVRTDKHCKVLIVKKLPCEHEIYVPCNSYRLQYDCNVQFEVQLPCLHSLSMICSDWKWIKGLSCTVQQTLLMPCGEVIQYTCSEGPSHAECEAVVLKCGHKVPCYTNVDEYKCDVPIKCVLSCSHEIQVPCNLHYFSQKLESVLEHTSSEVMRNCYALLRNMCRRKCDFLMKCGHRCSGCCGTCSRNRKHSECNEIVKKDLPCGHHVDAKCHVKYPDCPENCKILMKCGHRCAGLCAACTHNRKHSDCKELVPRNLPCGHHVESACHEKNPYCFESCKYLLECGHRCSGKCGDCKANWKHLKCHEILNKRFPCGHLAEYECHVKDPRCTERCVATLFCGHKCPGECGQCSKFNIHAMCSELVNKTLPCGHTVESACGSPLQVCERRCLFRCWHRRCINSCQYPCIKCSRPCEWKCEHFTCTVQCSQICDRPACNLRCPVTLRCGHQCVGYCGEPCPDLCLMCDKVDFDTKSSSNWYVLLEDCRHSLQMEVLSRYFAEKSPLSCPVCPTCGTVISKNKRFGNLIKSWLDSDLHYNQLKRYENQGQLSKNTTFFNTESGVLDDFVSQMIRSNINLAFISSTIKMYHNVLIIHHMLNGFSLSFDFPKISQSFKSLEQWILQHGSLCSEQQAGEACRAVRQLCALYFLKKFAEVHRYLKYDSYYSEIITLLETRTFDDGVEEQMLQMLHQRSVKAEEKSDYVNDLLCLIEDLNTIQKTPLYTEINIEKYFKTMPFCSSFVLSHNLKL